VDRGARDGREMEVGDAAAMHLQALDVVRKIKAEFGDKIQFHALDNTGYGMRDMPDSELAALRYPPIDEARAQAYHEAHEHFRRNAGNEGYTPELLGLLTRGASRDAARGGIENIRQADAGQREGGPGEIRQREGSGPVTGNKAEGDSLGASPASSKPDRATGKRKPIIPGIDHPLDVADPAQDKDDSETGAAPAATPAERFLGVRDELRANLPKNDDGGSGPGSEPPGKPDSEPATEPTEPAPGEDGAKEPKEKMDGDAEEAKVGNKGTDYKHLKDPKDVTKNTKPTPRQVKEMKEANRVNNDGALRDDVTGEPLVDSKKSKKDETPPPNAAEVDHVTPRSKGGTRSFKNLQLRSKKNNRAKSDSMPDEK